MGKGLFPIFSPSDFVGWGNLAGKPSTGVEDSLWSSALCLGRLGHEDASSLSYFAGRLGEGEP